MHTTPTPRGVITPVDLSHAVQLQVVSLSSSHGLLAYGELSGAYAVQCGLSCLPPSASQWYPQVQWEILTSFLPLLFMDKIVSSFYWVTGAKGKVTVPGARGLRSTPDTCQWKCVGPTLSSHLYGPLPPIWPSPSCRDTKPPSMYLLFYTGFINAK